MTPEQREAALRLARAISIYAPIRDADADEAAALLRELTDELAADPVQEPIAWLVWCDVEGLQYAAPWESAAHEQINDAINEHDFDGAAHWRVIPVYAHPPQRKPVAHTEYRLAETDIYDFAGWLTTRPVVMVVGSSSEAGPMAEAVGEYLRKFPDRFTPRQQPTMHAPLTEKRIWELVVGPYEIDPVELTRAVEAELGIAPPLPIAALREVMRISDRDHVAWNEVKAWLSNIKE